MFADMVWQAVRVQNIKRLGEAVAQRRNALGLSQERVHELGGPSTTTLTKIEAGTAKSIHRRTAQDLDRALGWKVGSSEALLFDFGEPVVVKAPSPDEGPPVDPLDGDEAVSLTVRSERDERGRPVIVGVSVSIDAEEVRSKVEVRYWPGSQDRIVSMGAFPAAVIAAHTAALEATSTYRKETPDGPQPAATNRAGESPAMDVVTAVGAPPGQPSSASERTESVPPRRDHP